MSVSSYIFFIMSNHSTKLTRQGLVADLKFVTQLERNGRGGEEQVYVRMEKEGGSQEAGGRGVWQGNEVVERGFARERKGKAV